MAVHLYNQLVDATARSRLDEDAGAISAQFDRHKMMVKWPGRRWQLRR
jgi:hypothetical protein